MKNLKRKVILSAIVLVFAFIATIGSTFAWFTVAQSVEVQSMELNVQASDSLMMRVYDPADPGETTTNIDLDDATTYSTTITSDDILLYYDYENWTLSPVTAINTDYSGLNVTSLNTMDINDYTRQLTPTTNDNANGGDYIEFKFYALSQSDSPQDVILQDLAIVSPPSNSDVQDEVANAVRIGVYSDYVYDELSEAMTENPTIESANVFGMDTDYGFIFDDPQSPGYWNETENNQTETSPNGTIGTWMFNSLETLAVDVTSAIDFYATDRNADWYDSSGTITTGEATDVKANATTIFTIPAASSPLDPILITVRIYIEGWDAQATNKIVSALFDISFKFAFKNEAI